MFWRQKNPLHVINEIKYWNEFQYVETFSRLNVDADDLKQALESLTNVRLDLYYNEVLKNVLVSSWITILPIHPGHFSRSI